MTYQAAAMELDENGVFAWLEGLGDQDTDVDRLVIDFLVRGSVDVEAVEASFGRGVIEWCHYGGC